MRYRACPRCQEVLPQEEFFRATNPDPMHTPLCSYCLGVSDRNSQQIEPATPIRRRTVEIRPHI